MGQHPETRPSLIVRLRNAQDADAWGEFVQVYEPVVYRLARQIGLQHADAFDATQEVLLTVVRVVDRWEPDPSKGTFRGWLYRVARNVIVRQLQDRRRGVVGNGGSDVQVLLDQHPAPTDEESRVFELEFRRQVFVWAAGQIRARFRESTWRAFWETHVENRPVSEVAGELALSEGAVYVARCRVVRLLRIEVERFLGGEVN
jgi:RNA polymerase sigma-70 factor (ECF subfamily)